MTDRCARGLPAAAQALREGSGPIGADGFVLAWRDEVTVVLANEPAGLLYGLFHVVRLGEAAFGGVVHRRAFVYDHRQDWRDRSTDRARAAYDHFAPLDGQFMPNAVLQVKHGPMDFRTREPVPPVIAAMPRTRVAVELQVTQEYTGRQRARPDQHLLLAQVGDARPARPAHLLRRHEPLLDSAIIGRLLRSNAASVATGM